MLRSLKSRYTMFPPPPCHHRERIDDPLARVTAETAVPLLACECSENEKGLAINDARFSSRKRDPFFRGTNIPAESSPPLTIEDSSLSVRVRTHSDTSAHFPVHEAWQADGGCFPRFLSRVASPTPPSSGESLNRDICSSMGDRSLESSRT